MESVARKIKKLPNINVVGVTSFPCLLYNEQTDKLEPTNNVSTIIKAAKLLKDMGFEINQINGPSATCVSSIPLLKRLGVTHGEPGHALTGTTPIHAKGKEPEGPAIVYVSEVSHRKTIGPLSSAVDFTKGKMKRAYLPDKKVLLDVEELPPESIDYYSQYTCGNELHLGDTVIYSFRTQIFVTRSSGSCRWNTREIQMFGNLTPRR